MSYFWTSVITHDILLQFHTAWSLLSRLAAMQDHLSFVSFHALFMVTMNKIFYIFLQVLNYFYANHFFDVTQGAL